MLKFRHKQRRITEDHEYALDDTTQITGGEAAFVFFVIIILPCIFGLIAALFMLTL